MKEKKIKFVEYKVGKMLFDNYRLDNLKIEVNMLSWINRCISGWIQIGGQMDGWVEKLFKGLLKAINKRVKKSSPRWIDGWMDGWMGLKAVLRIAYSNQKCCPF